MKNVLSHYMCHKTTCWQRETLFGQGLCVHLWTNWAFQHYQKRNLSVFQKQRNESNSFADKRGGQKQTWKKMQRIKKYSSFLELSKLYFQQQENIINKELQRSLEEVKNVVQVLLARFYSACHIPLLTQADLQTNRDGKRCKQNPPSFHWEKEQDSEFTVLMHYGKQLSMFN